jgi:hypothetical protein
VVSRHTPTPNTGAGQPPFGCLAESDLVGHQSKTEDRPGGFTTTRHWRSTNERQVMKRIVALSVLLLLFLADTAPAAWMPSREKPHSTLWAVGDATGDYCDPDDHGYCTGAPVSARIAADPPHRFLYLGDVYETGTLEEFQRDYEPLFGGWSQITAPTPGTHEWPNVTTGYNSYWGSKRGAPPPLWYAFKVSGWQFLSLNSNLPDAPEQAAWIKGLMDKSPRLGNCRIAFMHEPRHAPGRNGDELAVEPLHAALRGRAKAVLAGHDHLNARMKPVGGLTEFIAGAGGHGLYLPRPHPLLAWSGEYLYAALRIALKPGWARFSFVSANGTVLDTSTMRCRAEVKRDRR